jgi:hypothetical protein
VLILSVKLFRVLNDEMYYSTVMHCMVMSRKPSAYPHNHVSILLTEKIYIFICNRLIKIYILFINPNRPYDEIYMFWKIWLVWLCSIISIMFKNWCMSEVCWIDLNCLSVCYGWDLNYANCLRTYHVETVYVLWRNYDLNDFKVFD